MASRLREQKLIIRGGHRRTTEPARVLATSLIGGSVEPARAESSEETRDNRDGFVNAILFGNGVIRMAQRNSDIYALIIGGFQGIRFGDDEDVCTALVASRLPVEHPEGFRALEKVLTVAVREVQPLYVANHIGFMTSRDAADRLYHDAKEDNGVVKPWPPQ